jgi:hypothetical protein
MALIFSLMAGILWAMAPAAQAGGKLKSALGCNPTDEALTYDCMLVILDQGGQVPLANAKVVVGADMPSMPGAHHVVPVVALPGAEPGVYTMRIGVEMHGVWELLVGISGPTRRFLIHRLNMASADGPD